MNSSVYAVKKLLLRAAPDFFAYSFSGYSVRGYRVLYAFPRREIIW
jgi:hypothetical protein